MTAFSVSPSHETDVCFTSTKPWVLGPHQSNEDALYERRVVIKTDKTTQSKWSNKEVEIKYMHKLPIFPELDVIAINTR